MDDALLAALLAYAFSHPELHKANGKLKKKAQDEIEALFPSPGRGLPFGSPENSIASSIGQWKLRYQKRKDRSILPASSYGSDDLRGRGYGGPRGELG